MKERHILFSGPMLRAILAGQKTQTRRTVKPQPEWSEPATAWTFREDGHSGQGWYAYNDDYPEEGALFYHCPYSQPGDRLWVRETWMDLSGTGIEPITGSRSRYAYRADVLSGSYGDETRKEYGLKWRPSIFMPRGASRILLEIVSVRVERLQDISEADAIAEGAPGGHGSIPGYPYAATPHEHYRHIWESINGRGSWEKNPWVWVVEFKRTEPPKGE